MCCLLCDVCWFLVVCVALVGVFFVLSCVDVVFCCLMSVGCCCVAFYWDVVSRCLLQFVGCSVMFVVCWSSSLIVCCLLYAV